MGSRIGTYEDPSWKKGRPWQIQLSRFFNQAWVELIIGALVLVSVILTLFEFWLEIRLSEVSLVPTIFGEFGHHHLPILRVINDAITWIFIVELTLRYLAARSKRHFFAEFWLDILATLPLFRVFRSARALRLLRLFRLLRLVGVIARLSSHFPYILRRGAVDFLTICGLLMLAVTFGTLAIMHFESTAQNQTSQSTNLESSGNEIGEADNDRFGLHESFWFSVYTLFAGEPIPEAPRTLSGRIVTIFLMFMGMTIFAIFAGTVSAFMVDRMRVEGRIVEWDTLRDHIVICGWTPKTKIIIKEYRANPSTRKTPIVIISEVDPDELDEEVRGWANLMFIHDDFTKVIALERAGIHQARTCLVLTDTSGGRSEQDADARTILAALTVEKLNESVYTCAELVNRSYSTHLVTGKVNDFVVSGEYGAHMLAQAAMNRGLISVLSELLTSEHGNEFHRLPIPDAWEGECFDKKLSDVREKSAAILVAVHSVDESPIVNPQKYLFRKGDEVVVICRGVPKLS